MSAPRIHVEDVEWILSTDPRATVEHVAWRLHVSPSGIYRALARHGRDDLRDTLTRKAKNAA